MPTQTAKDTSNPFNVFQEHIVVAMVGLPARGKSYLSKAIIRYMNFLGCRAKLFNAGNSRRSQGMAGADASFFDASNQSATALREQLAMSCLEDLLEWISGDGCALGVLDATNTTVARRLKLKERCEEEMKKDKCIKLIFVESLADDPALLEQSYRMKLSNDDYAGKDPKEALKDFLERVKKYEAVYEPISDEMDGKDTRYMKLINAGQKLITNNIDGYVLRKLQRLISSVHLKERFIWLVLVGETESDLKGVLGGDPILSKAGIEYTKDIHRIIKERGSSSDENCQNPLLIYTGTLRRYVAMAQILCQEGNNCRSDLECCRARPCQMLTLGAANDLCGGLMDSMSDEEREEKFPLETAARAADKLNWRYPGVGGESYQDLIARSNEIICHLEQTCGDSVVIVDRAMYRAIIGYFMGKSIEEVPILGVQPGILELRRNHHGFEAVHLNTRVGKSTSSAGAGSKRYINIRNERGSLASTTCSFEKKIEIIDEIDL